MRVVAIVAVRNERPYLGGCLDHLVENEIDFFIVDNDSTDSTLDLLREERFRAHLVGYRGIPFSGVFHWESLMQAREAAAQGVDADWVVFVSADEIMHSYRQGETLKSAIERVSAAGHDVIDFNEFVFLPVDSDYVVDCRGPQPLRHYYFFEPHRPRLMRARRRHLRVSHVAHGGHVMTGEPFKLSPETFALRHYIFRDQAHAYRKYAERVFRPEEVGRGWHGNRTDQPVASFTFPAVNELHCLASPGDRDLCRAQPRRAHYWQWRR